MIYKLKFLLPIYIALASLEAGAISFNEFYSTDNKIILPQETQPIDKGSSITVLYDNDKKSKQPDATVNLDVEGEITDELLRSKESITLSLKPGKYRITISISDKDLKDENTTKESITLKAGDHKIWEVPVFELHEEAARKDIVISI